MRAFYGAGVCETVDQPFYQLSKNYNKKDIGLYRDDGRKKQKKFLKIYKKYLKITT